MSGKETDKPKRRKLLSDDDRELWSFVTRSVGPARGKSRVRDVEPDRDTTADAADRARVSPAPATSSSTPSPAAPRPRQPTHADRSTAKSAPPPQHLPLDRRKVRRIARGADEIDARLDLHGMTQDNAHNALIGFIRRCHGEGHRTVLVITGKGGAGGRVRDDDEVVPRPRGVLRRNVPRWLGGAELAALVISYSTAHIRHGGEGALYVRLRRS